jgi:hypothetical protein
MGAMIVKEYVASKEWLQVIQEYAKRDFTFVADRLPALAGIAKSFAAGNAKGEYLCGLWSGDLGSCFFWHVSSGKAVRRPDGYMPTWSWASTMGNVHVGGSYSVDFVQFKGHRIAYGGDEHMGDVKEGEVTLSGRVVPGTAFWEHETNDCLFGVVFDGTRIKVLADYAWDTEGKWLVADGSSVVMLLCGQSTEGSFDPDEGFRERVKASCLVLRCVDEAKALYERIGFTHGEGVPEAGYLSLEDVKNKSEAMAITVV